MYKISAILSNGYGISAGVYADYAVHPEASRTLRTESRLSCRASGVHPVSQNAGNTPGHRATAEDSAAGSFCANPITCRK
jgi:hypothetical protein